MNRWSNYLHRLLEALKRNQLVRAHLYVARHRSRPRTETQYAHDVTSTGTIVAVPREWRTPLTLIKVIRHRTTRRAGTKEPVLRAPAVGRVSRQPVDLIATLAITFAMYQRERLALTSGPTYNFTQT